MSDAHSDVIDRLAGIRPNSPMHGLRAHRPQARDNAQLSYLALFRPAEPGDVTLQERHAVAAFVAHLHGQRDIAAFYAAGLENAVVEAALRAEILRAAGQGPYGHYPAGGLSREDRPGPLYRVAAARRPALAPRLVAALEHAHLLVFHPRDAALADLQALLDAGWSATAVVTLSQLVAFLAFQIRVVVGLRCLAIVPQAA